MHIPTEIAPSVCVPGASGRRTEREFFQRLDAGLDLRVAGSARARPRKLLSLGYTPKHRFDLFDTAFYLTNVRQNEDIRFFVAYVVQRRGHSGRAEAHPRIFYKDVSLIWRSVSHYARVHGRRWIGKGDVVVVSDGEDDFVSSVESTTDLPFEMQTALEGLCRAVRRIPTDDAAVELILRRAPAHRVEPYRDFTGPRRAAQADRRNLVNGGRSIAWFQRSNDPTSLRFAKGYEPDFARGVIERSVLSSRIYGGRVRRFRILSRNRSIQYLFCAGRRHAWIIPPQALTTELSSYGVRTIDVKADEDLCVPGYEYHFMDETVDPPALFSQIPAGFAGAASEVDDDRADASRWLDPMPVIREFRARVLRRSR